MRGQIRSALSISILRPSAKRRGGDAVPTLEGARKASHVDKAERQRHIADAATMAQHRDRLFIQDMVAKVAKIDACLRQPPPHCGDADP